MHGWYREEMRDGEEGLRLWCLEKEGNEKQVFNTFLTFKEIELMCDTKEMLFKEELKF